MDFFTKLNLDGLYANQKPWHLTPWFLTPPRIHQINSLIQKINGALNQAPSVAHQTLHARFCSDYFWQTIATHSEYDMAHDLWQKTQPLIYASDATLVWFADFAFPLLEEYLTCSLQECEQLTHKTHARQWLTYLPGLENYLNSLYQLQATLNNLKDKLDELKDSWQNIIQLKIEQQPDLLKLIAQKLDIPCDFISENTLHTNALMLFKQNYHEKRALILPHRVLDKVPPLLSPTEAHLAWNLLTKKLKALKESHRFTAQKSKTSFSSWFSSFSQKNWPSFNQAKIYLFKKSIQYAGLPILIGLLIHGWLSFTSFGLGVGMWFVSPHLTTIYDFFAGQWQKWNLILDSSSEGAYREFLTEHAEYIETIERSALWRKNTLAPGCHHIDSFDPSLIQTTYEDFQNIFQDQINTLMQARPYFWQFWRHETNELINKLIIEITLEKEHLNLDIKNYAGDVGKRLNQPLFAKESYFLDKIIAFVLHFAPNTLNLFSKENQAIEHFLACVCQQINAPILFSRLLEKPSLFSSHCVDTVAIQHLINQIQPHIKSAHKWQAISAIAALLKQESLISIEQLDNYLTDIATQEYTPHVIKLNIQQHLFSTFNSEKTDIKKFFTPEHHKKLAAYLQSNQTAIEEARLYLQAFLDLPADQDWGCLPENFLVISPKIFKQRLALLRFGEHHVLISQLKNKLISLAPYYSGAPSLINQWLNVLWQENCPIELEEMIIESRFAWLLDHDHQDNKIDTETMQAFIQEMSTVFPKADHNHRLSRILVCQNQFYLPWQAHTQKMLDELEHNGLLLPSAKAGYSQKALSAWLQCK